MLFDVLPKAITPNDKPQTTNSKDKQRLQKQFNKAEKELNDLNEKKTSLELELSKPENYADKNKFIELEKQYSDVKEKILVANKEYEKAFEEMMLFE